MKINSKIYSLILYLSILFLVFYNCKLEEPISIKYLNIELYDLKTEPHTLKELSGKVVILDYWASWCTPCKDAGPLIDSLYHKLGSETIQFIGINTDTTLSLEDIQKYANIFGMGYPIWTDRELNLANLLEVQGQPCLVILDQDGLVVHKQYGVRPSDLFYLEKKILEISLSKQ